MNATDHEQFKAAECARRVMAAEGLREEAIRLSHALRLSGGLWSQRAEWALFDFCKAVTDLVDDGDVAGTIEAHMEEWNVDRDGFALDEDGNRTEREPSPWRAA